MQLDPRAELLTEVPDLYLDLLKRVLTRYGFTSYCQPNPFGWKRLLYRPLQVALGMKGFQLVKRDDPQSRQEGRDWPLDGETMTGMLRLDNLQVCATDVIGRNVPGDFIETGVWRGGATILMRAVLKAYGDQSRTVWVADSFRGLPKPASSDRSTYRGDELWKYSELSVPIEEVQANFAKYGLLDEQVQFLVGWFADTLPEAPIEKLALIRLDGDMFDSTMVALESLYPKLSLGGYVIVDDYGAFEECRAAVEEFRLKQGIAGELKPIDWTGVFWQRRA